MLLLFFASALALALTLTLALTIYLIPGLWGAPLKLVNAFLPPDFYAESPKGFGGGGNNSASNGTTTHAVDGMHEGPQGLMAFNDYDKALAYAKEVGKPLFVDFTGWGCVNCRKMEQSVWGEPGVIEHLRNDFVIVSLYVDERTELPKNEQKTEKVDGRDFDIVTIGNKWTAKQIKEYRTASQPYYVLKMSYIGLLNESAMTTYTTVSASDDLTVGSSLRNLGILTQVGAATFSGSLIGLVAAVSNGADLTYTYTPATKTFNIQINNGSITNSKLSNSSIIIDGQIMTLGASYTTQLSTITNAMLAGSIALSKLAPGILGQIIIENALGNAIYGT